MMVIVITVCNAAGAGIMLQVPYAPPIARIALEANETIHTAFAFPAAPAPSIEQTSHRIVGVDHSLLWRGGRRTPDGVVVEGSEPANSPPVEGCQASPDGVVVEVLHQPVPSPQSWFCRPNGLYYQTFSVALHTYYEPQSTVRTKTGGGFDVEKCI